MNNNKNSYKEKWGDYKKRSRLFWLTFLGYIPGTLILGWTFAKFFNSEMPFIVVAIIWMIAFGIVGLRLSTWRCPRCNDYFLIKRAGFLWLWTNIFTRKCLNCGLRKWAENDEKK